MEHTAVIALKKDKRFSEERNTQRKKAKDEFITQST